MSTRDVQTVAMIDALLYESRADERLTDAELEVILIGSRLRNARRGITGALLRDGDRIVQYSKASPPRSSARSAPSRPRRCTTTSR